MELKNKYIVLTGSRGLIGKAIMKELKRNNKIISIDKFKIQKQRNLDHYVCDLEDRKDRDLILKKIIKKYKKVDVLINCAGVVSDFLKTNITDIKKQNPKIWDKFIEINLTSIFDITCKLKTNLERSTNPSIINISSIYATSYPDWEMYKNTNVQSILSYSVSKGGLLNLTKWLATYLAPKIRVNAISPGGIKRKQTKAFIDKYIKKTPMKRMCSTNDVVGCIKFLSSDDSSYITGQNIIVDGGFTLS